MKRQCMLAAIVGLVSIASAALAQSPMPHGGLIHVAIPGNAYAALSKATPTGVIAQAVDAILRQMPKNPIHVTTPTSVALKSLEDGRMDVATVVVPTQKIKDSDSLWLSAPVLNEFTLAITLKGKRFPLERLADLRDKRIGAREGYIYSLLDGEEQQMNMMRYRSDGEMIRSLLFGDIDLALIGGMSDLHSLRTEGIINKLETLPIAVGTVPLVVAFSKKTFTAAEVQTFDALLAEFKRGAAWQEILNQNGFADLVRDWPLIDTAP